MGFDKNRFSRFVTSRWEASDTVGINTDWLSSDVAAPANGNDYEARKYTLLIMVPTSSVVNVIITDGTTAKTAGLNEGTALSADAWYSFDVLIPVGYSFNIQHETGTQNVALFVFESSDLNL